MTADALGEVEQLGYGQDRPLRRVFLASAPDLAWVTRDDPVLFDGSGEHGAKQSIGLGPDRFRYTLGKQPGNRPDRRIDPVVLPGA